LPTYPLQPAFFAIVTGNFAAYLQSMAHTMKSGAKGINMQASQRSKGELCVQATFWFTFRGRRFFSHELAGASGAAGTHSIQLHRVQI
jgi:hypothetical protein